MSSYNDDQQFAKEVCGNILPEAIDWIKANMKPEDVFDEDDLTEWAEEHDFEKVE